MAGSWRAPLLVFAALCCLYLLSGGGQGYSIDGTFSYSLAHAIASDPSTALSGQNRDTLKRWGPVVPALGVPFAWLGARLGDLAPQRDTVAVDGAILRLYDWPVVGAGGSDGAAGGQRQADLPLPRPVEVSSIRLVSFLSFAAGVADGTPVAELILEPVEGSAGSTADPTVAPARVVLLAGRDAAEWSYDVPAADRPRHSRARLAGHWPGEPRANLYYADLTVPSPIQVRSLAIRYLAPAGRLHLRSVLLRGPQGAVELPGPPTWSPEQQDALFSRFGFSSLNAPLMALTCALLVPLASLLGYPGRSALALGAGFGVATLAWPYAKHDFSETAAACCAVAAAVSLYAAHTASLTARRHLAVIAAAGALAALAAGAKYTAIWFLPLLAIQHVLLSIARYRHSAQPATQPAATTRESPGRPASRNPLNSSRSGGPLYVASGGLRYLPLAVELATFFAPAAIAAAGAVVVAGAAPTIWAGWRGGLARGWLDFPVWVGLYGLLVSPGKSVFLYAPPLLLAVLGAAAFVRHHRAAAFLFVAVPLVYLAVFATKGVWHGGGWGPRYLLPALPFAACLALPALARATVPAPDRFGRALRRLSLALFLVGIGVQVLGVAKHPNLFGVMYRDHILPALPDYGAALGGPPALAYWRHFGGPDAFRQLARPPAAQTPAGDELRDVGQRSLGYLFAETGPLELRLDLSEARTFDATVYTCDWDRRGRRQRLTLDDQLGRRIHEQAYPLGDCEFLTWQVSAGPGRPAVLHVDAVGPDVPVISAVFFDPAVGPRADAPRRIPAGPTAWHERFGADGYVLFAWRRSGEDLARPPAYLTGYSGGDRVWIDTGELDLADTAPLYASAFSPVAAHAWLLGADAVAALVPANVSLLQRALASPPWRYLAGLELHAPHPEYGLGLDFWPLLLHSHFSSHPGFMAGVWLVAGALAAGFASAATGLVWHYRALGYSGAATTDCPRPGPRRVLSDGHEAERLVGGPRSSRPTGAGPVVGQDAARQ